VPKSSPTPTKSPKKSNKKIDYVQAVGRRKTATARVRLYTKKAVPGSEHSYIVNGQRGMEYFPGALNISKVTLPLSLTGLIDKYSFSAKVTGSGKRSQLASVIHALSRALVKYNPEFRPTLKKAGLLTRDPRAKERRKVGTGGKARRRKQSPKR